MPPIMMTGRERADLARLARSPVPKSDIKPQHAEKFVNHGLAVNQALRLKITPKGQLELLRQRFRRMSTRTVHVTEEDFRTRLDRRLRSFLADPDVEPADSAGSVPIRREGEIDEPS